MGFCEGIKKALKCNVGIYDLKGKILYGFNTNFRYTDDVLYSNNSTYIRCGEMIVSADCLLSQDAVNLIRMILSLEQEKEAATFMQPLEYILKNDISYESLIGRYEGYTVLYIKCREDVEDILFNIYSGYDVELVKDDDGIYLIKKFEDIENEANSIINGIGDERGINIIIGSGRMVKDKYTIKHSSQDAKLSAVFAEKLGFKNGYFVYDKMVIYEVINSLDIGELEKLYDEIYRGFFDVIRDRELINTAEEFLKRDLNISEAARRLYIHRNTLLYRIEKIKSLTGLDIKSFEEAMIFKFLLIIYRLKSK
ncbi:MAG: helix-turn-helix domain-containing protein [Caloramator sp.]|nr:helix-turn-helix domain-containing protein [Caloramator sp.]